MVMFDDEKFAVSPFQVKKIRTINSSDPNFTCTTKKCRNPIKWVIEETNDYGIKRTSARCDSCHQKIKETTCRTHK